MKEVFLFLFYLQLGKRPLRICSQRFIFHAGLGYKFTLCEPGSSKLENMYWASNTTRNPGKGKDKAHIAARAGEKKNSTPKDSQDGSKKMSLAKNIIPLPTFT